ncbi:MAG: DUF2062 domain-containing protein [Inquilinaceae bacterium]
MIFRLRRQYFRRFLRPINKHRMTPNVVGRTMMVGLAWGVSATVGLQLVGVAVTWVMLSRWLGKPFSLAIAALLTGITNPLTVPPLYTMYYLTGCMVADCPGGVFNFQRLVDSILEYGVSWRLIEGSWRFLAIAFAGSLPYAIAAAAAGFYGGRFIGRQMHRRRQRRSEPAAPTAPVDDTQPPP